MHSYDSEETSKPKLLLKRDLILVLSGTGQASKLQTVLSGQYRFYSYYYTIGNCMLGIWSVDEY